VSPALHVNSGYGIQARYLTRHLLAAGHHVEILAISGIGGGTLNIGGVTHRSGGRLAYQAGGTLERHAAQMGADVILTLCDLAHQDAHAIARLRGAGVQVLHWVPADCEPLSVIDEAVLRYGGGHPVAMSRFGERMLTGAGFEPSYVPHAVDTGMYVPFLPETRDALRAGQGTLGRFTVACCAANADLSRKGFFEMWRGFAAFHVKHPDTAFLLHSEIDGQFDHDHEIRHLGLEDCVIATDDHLIQTGQLDGQYMAAWFNSADVYLCASWAEGFGVPLIEAQACGVPVIGTDCSAVTELVQPGTGWRVPGEPKYNPLHKRAWLAPSVKGLAAALGKAHTAWQRGGSAWAHRRGSARQIALGYDTDLVWERDWKPLLARCEAGDFKAKESK
jgi:glycosyltransferase involved in cell wall biosynthesis